MMERKIIAVLTAVLLCLSVCSVEIFADTAGKTPDLNAECSITVQLAQDDYADLTAGDVLVDIFKVGSVSMADDGSLQIAGDTGFDDLGLETVNKSGDNAALADACLARLDGQQPAASGRGGQTIGNLSAGLYLIILHGEQDENCVLNTQAHTYTFVPTLVALPNTGETMTSVGQGFYDMTINMKSEQSVRYVTLVIEKTIDKYDPVNGAANFIFRVDAANEDGTAFSQLVHITMTVAGTASKEISVPVNAETLTVTEVYSGGSYTPQDGNVRVTSTAGLELGENPESVHFTNNYTGEGIYSTGFNNHYFYDSEAGQWDCAQSKDGELLGNASQLNRIVKGE